MIRILSLNPSLDRVMNVPNFMPGQVIRANYDCFFASGKGVNAAFAVATLNEPCNLHCIVGVNEIREFSNLHPLISCDVAPFDGLTRSNVTISEKTTKLVCHIQVTSPSLAPEFIDSVAEHFIKSVCDGDVAVVSGSVPAGVRPDFLADILTRTAQKGAILIVDVDPAYWSLIDWSVVHWTKPNLEELSSYVGRSLVSEHDIYEAVIDSGLAERTVVSLGVRGAILINRKTSKWILGQTNINFDHTTIPIGCGDSMIGGFATALSHRSTDAEVLSYGLSAGCANLAGTSPGRIDRRVFESALESVVIKQV